MNFFIIIPFQVIEPLADFHKDEVRRLGADLNIPNELTQRHPFPGIFWSQVRSSVLF